MKRLKLQNRYLYGINIGFVFMVITLSIVRAQSFSLPSLPGINKQEERRVVVNPSQKPWSIIGRVQTDLGQKCTGFLISPRIVSTAAHCLWVKKTQRFVAPQSIYFAFQYQRGHYAEIGRIQKIIVSKQYRGPLSGHETLEDIAVDKAYLILNKAIKLSYYFNFAMEEPVVGTPLLLAGYDQDRIEVLYADQHCEVKNIITTSNGKIIQHNCQGTYGSSGAPLLMKKGDHFEIVGNQVAAYSGYSGGLANFTTNRISNINQ